MKMIAYGISFAALTLLVSACDKPASPPKEEPKPVETKAQAVAVAPLVNPAMLQAFKPSLPKQFANKKDPSSEARVTLGRMLYFDKRLSKNHDVSCNSCHQLDKYGVDGEITSPGHKGQRGGRNSPTVYNAAGHFVQFWDGRSPDVEDQATGPVLNPIEMAMADEAAVAKVLNSIPDYVAAFKGAFPKESDPVSLKNAGRAIGSFERGLVTPSPWDKFLDGDDKALSDEQKAGFAVFNSSGCMGCHTGTLVGAANYQKVGAIKAWPNQKDQGRFEVTKLESDKMMFKPPSLRNITETAPYFHDGSASTLQEAVKMMGLHQLGRTLSQKDVASIIAWLGALKGELPKDYIKQPELPKSTESTPKADPT